MSRQVESLKKWRLVRVDRLGDSSTWHLEKRCKFLWWSWWTDWAFFAGCYYGVWYEEAGAMDGFVKCMLREQDEVVRTVVAPFEHPSGAARWRNRWA